MKAIVLEKKNGRCVVLRRDGVFEETADKGWSVGEQGQLPPRGLGVFRSGAARRARWMGILTPACVWMGTVWGG